MTTSEWLGLVTGASALGGSVFGVGLAWGVLRYKVSGHQERIKKLEDDFEEHAGEDASPHTLCGRHEELLKSVAQSLEKLIRHHETLDQRVFELIKRNGASKR